MEKKFKKCMIFGVATFGILVIASIIGDKIIGVKYYYSVFLRTLLQFSPLLSVIIGIFVGMALDEGYKAPKAGGSIGFIGFLMVSLSFIIFSEGSFEGGEIFIAFAIVCVISGAGGGFLGRYFSPLFYFTSQQRYTRDSSQPSEERYEGRQSGFDRTMNNVQNESGINTKNEGRQNQFENTPSSSTETEPPQPASEVKSNVCPECGRDVEDDWNVCIDCGTSLK